MIRIASFFVIFTAAVLVAYFMYFREPYDLPVYEPADLNPALVDPEALKQESHRILDFELVNQEGDTVRRADVKGQILVVDFFFTRCATICPKMSWSQCRPESRPVLLLENIRPNAPPDANLPAPEATPQPKIVGVVVGAIVAAARRCQRCNAYRGGRRAHRA